MTSTLWETCCLFFFCLFTLILPIHPPPSLLPQCLIPVLSVDLALTTRTCMTHTKESVFRQSVLPLTMDRLSLWLIMKMAHSCAIVHMTSVPSPRDSPLWMLFRSTWRCLALLGLVLRRSGWVVEERWLKKKKREIWVITLHKQSTESQNSTLQINTKQVAQVSWHDLAQDHANHLSCWL